MLSPEHEIPAELFRSCPELARELLRSRGIVLPPGTTELTTIDATQSIPTEARADVVIVIRDPHGDPMHAIVIEVQTGEDADKRFAWPLYVAAMRARLRCPTMLLVFATSETVARWSRQPIDLGHPGFTLAATVISFADVPDVVDGSPELVVLAAAARPDTGRVRSALAAIHHLPEDRRRVYFIYLLRRAREIVNDLEIFMTPEMIEQLWKEAAYEFGEHVGRKKGVEEGREEGRQKGLEEGRKDALRRLAMKSVGEKAELLAPEVATLIERLDGEALEQLVVALIGAHDEEAVRAIVSRPA